MNNSTKKRMSVLALSIFATATTLSFSVYYTKMPPSAAPFYQSSQMIATNNS